MINKVDKEFYANSSAIARVGVIVADDELYVEFTSGDKYVYYMEPYGTDNPGAEELFNAWFEAPSAGTWYRENLMGEDNEKLRPTEDFGVPDTPENKISATTITTGTITSDEARAETSPDRLVATGELIDAQGKRVTFRFERSRKTYGEVSMKNLLNAYAKTLGLWVLWVTVS